MRDTPRITRVSAYVDAFWQGGHMSASTRTRFRANGTTARKMLQGRVTPQVHAMAVQRAAAAGLPLAVYLEQLVLRDSVDYSGRPTWAPAPNEQEALLNSA